MAKKAGRWRTWSFLLISGWTLQLQQQQQAQGPLWHPQQVHVQACGRDHDSTVALWSCSWGSQQSQTCSAWGSAAAQGQKQGQEATC